MGALSPLFLLAGAVVAVPLLLHLVQRHEGHRIPFPALRYLRRTEKDHARRIRSRQLLLLLLRVSVVVGLVAAGARLFVHGRGSAHPPTALALILDNSMSSGRVVGDETVLDHLKALALTTLDEATDADRIWVLRAGEPWAPLAPTGPDGARRAVRGTEASAARGDLSAALARAAALVSSSGLPGKEVQLLSDLQATAFDDTVAPAGSVPVVVWTGSEEPGGGRRSTAGNRSLTSVVVGGGLPPLVGQRADVAVEVAASVPDDTAPVPVRLIVGEQVRGAGSAAPGAAASISLPPAAPGWVRGYADIDPDALRADDRRYFVFRARPAPTVAVSGDPGIFVREAMDVLAGSGRVQPRPVAAADVVVSASGEGLDAVPGSPGGRAVLVLPPADGALLPALNRRLREAGIPWQLERAVLRGAAAEDTLSGPGLPAPLAGVRVRAAYGLVADPASGGQGPSRIVARVGAAPWAVEGTDALGRRYLLLASPLDGASSTLPVSAAMVPFVAWVTDQWASAGGGPVEHPAGRPLSAPAGATAVRLPSGAEVAVDRTGAVLTTGAAGFYTFLAGDSVVSVEAVNPPPVESDLTPLPRARLGTAVGPKAVAVARASSWGRQVFRTRHGLELWRGLLAAALALLLVEAGVAAAGRSRGRVALAAGTGAAAHGPDRGPGRGAHGAA